MNTTTLILSTFLFFGLACNSTKQGNQAQEVTSSETTRTMQESKNGNSLKGIIIANKNEKESCTFFIKDEKTNTVYDPINLDEAFHKDNMTVWFTYTPLRMANRCGKANPINISSIEKRVE